MGINVKEILGESYRDDLALEELVKLLAESNNVVSNDTLQAQIDKNDKLSTENANYRKEINANKTQEELKQEEYDNLVAQNEELQKQLQVIEMEKSFVAMGYDEKLASDTAQAYVEGDTKKMFKNMNAFNESQEKMYKEQLLKDTKTPTQTDVDNKPIDKKQFFNMSLREQADFAENNPEEYERLSKGE